ncbi:MAG: hypothetical protein ACI9H6_000148 [Patiriisocius sp.]|jgi:hypothetical protein
MIVLSGDVSMGEVDVQDGTNTITGRKLFGRIIDGITNFSQGMFPKKEPYVETAEDLRRHIAKGRRQGQRCHCGGTCLTCEHLFKDVNSRF